MPMATHFTRDGSPAGRPGLVAPPGVERFRRTRSLGG